MLEFITIRKAARLLVAIIGLLMAIIIAVTTLDYFIGSPQNSADCPSDCVAAKCILHYATNSQLLSSGPCQCSRIDSIGKTLNYCSNYLTITEGTYLEMHQWTYKSIYVLFYVVL